MRAFILLISIPLALTCFGQSPAKQLAECQKLYDAKSYPAALEKINSLIANHDTIAQAFKLRGDIRQRLDDLEGALDDYKASKDLDNDNPRLFVSRSAARITMGNYNGAIRDLERALKLDPTDSDAQFNLACTKYITEDYKGAMQDIAATLDLNPEHANAYFLRGLIKGEEYQEAEGLLDIEKALTLDPEIQGGKMSAAILLFELGEYEQAIERFTELLKTVDADDRAAVHYYRADCYYNLDNKEKACEDFRRSARFGDPDAPIVVSQYCETDAKKIKRIPRKRKEDSRIQF